VFTSLALMAGTASATTPTVCESGPPTCRYSHIQEAVNAASSGDTIEIAAGTFSAGIIFSSGTLTLNNSTVSHNTETTEDGGGIVNERSGTVTLNNSTVSDNSAESGGGIYNASGTVTLSNAKVSENTATIKGGGIFNETTLVGSNDTITGNTPDGIFDESPGTVNLKNSNVQSP
jgi:hypothetical protein